MKVRKEFTVHWQSGTNEGIVVAYAFDGQQAYQIASPALASISLKRGYQYMNVTVSEIGDNPMSKRTVRIHDALLMKGKLWGTLTDGDEQRGWASGKSIITTRVDKIGEGLYESKNTIYQVVGELTVYPSTSNPTI